jgi:hypothetical protein
MLGEHWPAAVSDRIEICSYDTRGSGADGSAAAEREGGDADGADCAASSALFLGEPSSPSDAERCAVRRVGAWEHPGDAFALSREALCVEVNVRRQTPWTMPAAISEARARSGHAPDAEAQRETRPQAERPPAAPTCPRAHTQSMMQTPPLSRTRERAWNATGEGARIARASFHLARVVSERGRWVRVGIAR